MGFVVIILFAIFFALLMAAIVGLLLFLCLKAGKVLFRRSKLVRAFVKWLEIHDD